MATTTKEAPAKKAAAKKEVKIDLKTKRFVVRQSLVGKNTVIEFTNKKGDVVIYNHDKAFSLMKENLEKLACWAKYKSYTATNNIPVVLRGQKLV
jgi:hypothetical protein